MRLSLLAALSVLAFGCVEEPGTHPLEIPSVGDFAATVQPMLTKSCASASCHGRRDRALVLYAPGAYRSDPARLYLDEPLTPAELKTNALNVAAFAQGEAPMLRKPLPPSAGGLWHGGGDVFAGTQDPGYQALVAWLAAP